MSTLVTSNRQGVWHGGLEHAAEESHSGWTSGDGSHGYPHQGEDLEHGEDDGEDGALEMKGAVQGAYKCTPVYNCGKDSLFGEHLLDVVPWPIQKWKARKNYKKLNLVERICIKGTTFQL